MRISLTDDVSMYLIFSMSLMGAIDKKAQRQNQKALKKPGPLTEQEAARQTSLHESLSKSAAIKAKAMEEELAHSNQSVLRQRLSQMADLLGYFGLSVAVCTVILLITSFCVEKYIIEGNDVKFAHVKYALYYFVIGVTIFVVAVPEGYQPIFQLN